MKRSPASPKKTIRSVCALLISLIIHFVCLGFLFLWINSIRDIPRRELFSLNLVELPAPPPVTIPQKIEPEEEAKIPEKPPRRKVRRIRKQTRSEEPRGRLAALQVLQKATRSEPDPIEQHQEERPQNQEVNEKLPEKIPDIFSTEKIARSHVIKGIVEQSDEDLIQEYVRAVVKSPSKAEERINDQPLFPLLTPDEDGNYTWDRHGLHAKIRPDGTVEFRLRYGLSINGIGVGEPMCKGPATDPDDCQLGQTVPALPGITPSLDSTDLLYMAHGDDPRAAWKRWFFKQTREFRDELAQKFQKKLLVSSPDRMRANIRRIWSDGSATMAHKRRLLFELWDECADSEAGQKVRGQLIHFIRQKFPPESPEAFTPQELGAFNASRLSKQSFSPYKTGKRASR